MYAENFSSEMEEDFYEALALLRSNDEDSEEKLRTMLDALIESKYGSTKTLAFRMPKEFLRKEKTRWKTYSKNSVRLVAEKKKETNELKNEKILTKQEYNVTFKIDFEEGENEEGEKIDVPRISIPDEGSTDGALCKICNGAKLGPLILLECQECQEIYHPLCHNPPVVDMDVYDPRLVWRCGKCNEATSSSSSTTSFREVPSEDSQPDVRMTIFNKFSATRAIDGEGQNRSFEVDDRPKGTKRRH